ncbi:MAG: hypothetical protein IPM64_05925 [Phycisphaerales bacterium]|nr:hypothetical protein [Phycisphaerales bacterium]
MLEHGGGVFGKVALADHHAVEPRLGDHAIGLADAVADAVVIERDAPFENDALEALGVVHEPEESAARELGQLERVDGVVFFVVLGDESVAAWVADARIRRTR